METVIETGGKHMKTYLLPENGNLYKANLHTHSTLSDGALTPEELKKHYMAHGYSAVAFTDHRACIPHPELTDDKFVALTSVEMDYSARDDAGIWARTTHYCAIARDPKAEFAYPNEPLPLLSHAQIDADIAEMNGRGFITTVNHPVWSDMSMDEVAELRAARGVEVFNSYAVTIDNYSEDSAFFERVLRSGAHVRPVASDDCHTQHATGGPGREYFRGFNVLKAPELTYDTLIHALDTDAFFASTGPLFENLWLEDDMLHVECSPVCGVFVHGRRFSQTTNVMEDTDCIESVDLDISKFRKNSPYIWVQLCDTKGHKAWAVPYWFE